MYLNKMYNKSTNKTYLSICRGFRAANGKVKHSTIQSLGAVEDLKKQFEDPVAHFTEIVKQMNVEEKLNKAPINIKLNKEETITLENAFRRNFGYAAFSKIYHELQIDKFCLTKFSKLKVSPNKLNNILKLLVFGRLIFPDSKKSTYESKDVLF